LSDQREQWGSSLGFILAAVGGAVGLGNLWSFPYKTWSNGGGTFVFVYFVCVLAVGLPILVAEILIGRTAQKSPVPAFEKLGGPLWSLVGWMGVICGAFILSFYTVVAGWSISSFVDCLRWSLTAYQSPDFAAFTSNGWAQIGLAGLFSTFTATIVYRGIGSGIERANRVLMPVLGAMLLLILINTSFLDGFGQAFGFLLTPDLAQIEGTMVIAALGQAFFTLSLGMGGMITYGSYMRREDSIPRAALSITAFDTLIAAVAALILFTILFSFPEVQQQISADPAPMLFVLLPELFYNQMPFGNILGPLFFVLVGFAALSSTISLLEVVVSLFIDKVGLSRRRATLISAGSIFGLSILCGLSLGAVPFLADLSLAGQTGVMGIFSHVSTSWALPIGGFFIATFVGWRLDPDLVRRELGLADRPVLFQTYRFTARFIAPITILIVFYFLNFG